MIIEWQSGLYYQPNPYYSGGQLHTDGNAIIEGSALEKLCQLNALTLKIDPDISKTLAFHGNVIPIKMVTQDPTLTPPVSDEGFVIHKHSSPDSFEFVMWDGTQWVELLNNSVIFNQLTRVTDYTTTDEDDTIFIDATSGDFTLTLVSATEMQGRRFAIKRIDTVSANNVTVQADGAELIGPDNSVTLQESMALILESDGTQWWPVLDSINFKVENLTAHNDVIFTPSGTQNITAAGGITPSNAIMEVQGSGGAVDITANPQIAAGSPGQLLIIEGESDTNTLTLEDGNGLHLHGGKAILRQKDIIGFYYDSDDSEYHEMFRSFPITPLPFNFSSPVGGGATFCTLGCYQHGASDNDFNPAITLGTANKSEAAHIFFVQAAGGGGGTDTVVRITGTTMNDQGTRATGQTVDVTLDNAGVAGTYYETLEKWLGQPTLTKLSGPDLLCNYGFCKYWDQNNTDFRVIGHEITWLGGANDTNPEIKIYHHKATGWTYNNGASATPPTPFAQLTTDHSTDDQVRTGEFGAWKRDNHSEDIDGSGAEGIVVEITTTAARTFQFANGYLIVRPH
jgi:hypothetical protein